MKSAAVCCWPLAALLLGPRIAQAAALADFQLSATEQNFALYFPTYLANGFFSAQSSLRGTDATLAQMVGLMDYTPGDVSRPAAIPSWTEIDYFDGAAWLNQTAVTPAVLQHYRQTLDMHDGVLTTQYMWQDGGRASRIALSTFVSEADARLGVTTLSVTPEFAGRVRLRFTLRPWPAPVHRFALAKLSLPETKQAVAAAYRLAPPSQTALLSQVLKPLTPTAANRAAIWYPGEVEIQSTGASEAQRLLWIRGRAVNGAEMAEAAAIALPEGLRGLRIKVAHSPQLVALEIEMTVEQGRSYTFTKYVAVGRDPAGGSIEEEVHGAKAARAATLHTLLANHRTAWHDLWKSDILVDGDPDLQRAIHSDLFYLLENTSVDTDWPIAACGFSPNYFYHVFWDNDSWDFPPLLLLHPERAKSQVMFRYRTLAAAEARARAYGYQGAMFPWEADPGRGTDETPYFAHENADQEIHVNADVAIAQWQYYLASGDLDWLRRYGYPVIRATAEFWASRVVYRPEKDLPHDKHTWMGSSISWLGYPQLDLPMSEQVRRNDFRFAVRSLRELTPDANAMLLAMLSVEAAELGDEAGSYKWLQGNEGGFLKPPFNVRSETVLNNTTYILATSGGFLQNFLYGFTGLRITDGGLAPRFKPVLPAAWKAVTLKNIFFRAQRFDYVLSRDPSGKVQASRHPVR
ncbi:MAG: glycoside hydrolase family 65 protein [Gammaproteobacteria bacterium]|nr:MAG: glycoside hydrolase family 65 protein [Gammaproteobacteria bacterium]